MNGVHRIPPSTETRSTSGWKSGVRVLGVSESFTKDSERSVVAGVVMRGDLRIDGFGFCHPQVGGTDATAELLGMFRRLERGDVRAWLLGGGVISWFNVVDLRTLSAQTGIPVVCVSFDESNGLEKYIREYFPDDWQQRVETLEKAGDRRLVSLETGHSVYVVTAGIGVNRARQLLNLFTLDGRVPEPVRVARQLAAAVHRNSEP
jgi:endonuclease V-like protein UPF0215 family